MPGQESEIDLSAARELLGKKYSLPESSTSNRAVRIPGITESSEKTDWKLIADERLAALQEKSQLLNAFQNEINDWKEAFFKEKERCDKFESLLLDQLIETRPVETQEVKHTINPINQVNRRRANWPSFKAAAENKFRKQAENNGEQQAGSDV